MAGTALVGLRRHDGDIVGEFGGDLLQHVEPWSADAVVVGEKNAHAQGLQFISVSFSLSAEGARRADQGVWHVPHPAFGHPLPEGEGKCFLSPTVGQRGYDLAIRVRPPI